MVTVMRAWKQREMKPGAGGPFRQPDGSRCPLCVVRSGFFQMARIRNVFEIIELYGHDENFEPHATTEFIPTAAPAGSKQKIDILAERIQRGMPLWHPEDSTDSSTADLVAQHA